MTNVRLWCNFPKICKSIGVSTIISNKTEDQNVSSLDVMKIRLYFNPYWFPSATQFIITDIPTKKWGKYKNEHTTKAKIQLANKHMTKNQTTSVIREITLKLHN